MSMSSRGLSRRRWAAPLVHRSPRTDVVLRHVSAFACARDLGSIEARLRRPWLDRWRPAREASPDFWARLAELRRRDAGSRSTLFFARGREGRERADDSLADQRCRSALVHRVVERGCWRACAVASAGECMSRSHGHGRRAEIAGAQAMYMPVHGVIVFFFSC